MWTLVVVAALVDVPAQAQFGPEKMLTFTADAPASVHAADLDEDGDADVLSASTFDDKIAWYEKLFNDCNANAVPDDQDITSGLSADCNGNGAPDECELDCNHNGVADTCDIAHGTSLDCNQDGIPDECQGNPCNVTYCTPKVNSDGCGALMSLVGAPSLTAGSVFSVEAFAVKPASTGLLFYGLGGPASAPFQGGTLCVQPPTRRTPLQSSGGSFFCEGVLTFDFNTWIQNGNEPLIEAGSQVNAQCWYLDVSDPLGVGLTNAVEFFVAP